MQKVLYIFFLFFSIPPLSVFSQSCPPVVSYTFENNVHDYSGNGYGATLFNDADVSSGYLETGDNAYDYAGIPVDVLDGAGDFTISFNFIINAFHTTGASPTNSIIAGANSSDEAAFAIAYEESSNSINVAINSSSHHFFISTIAEETWYCLTMIRDDADVSIYIDGVLLDTYTMNDEILDITFLEVGQEVDCDDGCFAANQCLNGAVDNLVIYPCVNEAFSCEAFIIPCDTALLYDFNGNVTDHSGNGYDGTLHEGADVSENYLKTGLNNIDYVEIPVDALNAINDFRISFNFRINEFNTTGTSPTNSIIAGINNPSEAEFAIAYQKSSDAFVIAINNIPGEISADIESDRWYCFSLYRDGETIHIEIDGLALPGTITLPAGELSIEFLEIGQEVDCVAGCFATDQSFNGSMDNLYITECADVVCADFPDAIPEQVENFAAQIYPNPATQYICIDIINNYAGTLSLMNMNGNIIVSQDITDSRTIVDISTISRGMYIIQYKNAGEVLNKKIVKL